MKHELVRGAKETNSTETYDSLSVPINRTVEFELALGSDSIGSIESANTPHMSQPSSSQNYLLGSDSLET